jgi:hypothetical protein
VAEPRTFSQPVRFTSTVQLRGANASLTTNDRGTVTQITTIATGVTLNTLAGTITTVSQTLAAAAEGTFVVTNSRVAATDVVVACLASTTSAGGPFMVGVTAVAAGSFTITVTNTHSANAGDNTLVINYIILKAA